MHAASLRTIYMAKLWKVRGSGKTDMVVSSQGGKRLPIRCGPARMKNFESKLLREFIEKIHKRRWYGDAH